MTQDLPAAGTSPDPLTSAVGYAGSPDDRAEWDRRYAEQDQMWSGRPNGTLVAEVANLTPGRVLDVGCGEGADAIWLASTGWDVTALDVSGVALERAAAHAAAAGVSVRWVHAGLVEAALPSASFDLVSAQYPVLVRTPDAIAERTLLDLVAPGGVLLFVHHAGMAERHDHDHGDDHDHGHDDDAAHAFDPADHVWPAEVSAALPDGWHVEVDELRPRDAPESGAGAHHADDLVLRVRRPA